jgi:D-alanine-D-alanine ligase
MPPRVAIIYNDPVPDRYDAMGETKAIVGVLDEVAAVEQALTTLKYPVKRVPLLPPLTQVSEHLDKLDIDVIFNLFEGFDGVPETEGEIAAMLAEKGRAFTGCPAPALQLALNKTKSMQVLQEAGIPVPDYQLLQPEILSQFRLGFPCIVKPATEHASHGMSTDSVVKDLGALIKQVNKVSALYGGKALVQEFLEGREFNVTVVGNGELAALPLAEVIYTLPPDMPRILTFASKWDPQSTYFQHTRVSCPTRNIAPQLRDDIIEIALSSFLILGCSGYARIDMRLDRMGQPHVMEVNPNPDISPEYGAARQARAAGMTYEQFIEKIVLLALEKKL